MLVLLMALVGQDDLKELVCADIRFGCDLSSETA